MSFPLFPKFRPIALGDKNEYEAYYKRFEPYSDFEFTNLINWLNFYHDLEISRDSNNLILRYSNVFDAQAKAYTIIGKRRCLHTVEAVFDFQAAHNEPQLLSMMPECTVAGLIEERTSLIHSLLIRLDPGNSDYVFDVPAAFAMHGKKYEDIRYKLNFFNAHYKELVTVKYLDLGSTATQRLLRKTLQQWMDHESFTRNDPQYIELQVLDNYFRSMKSGVLSPSCIALYMGGRLAGFCLYHLPAQKDWVIVDHIKCEPKSYKNLFLYMRFVSLRHFAELGVRYENAEQDLNIEGLRNFKRQQHPARYLWRYEISRV